MDGDVGGKREGSNGSGDSFAGVGVPYPSHLLKCVGVHGLRGQEAVSLARPSP